MIPDPPSPVPNRGLPQDTFDAAIAAFFGYISSFVTSANALLSNVLSKSDNADTQAAAAAASATAALASQNTSAINAAAAAASAGASTWNPATNYAQDARAIDPSTQRSYYRRVPGVTAAAPSTDPVNWGVVQLSRPLQTVTARAVAAMLEVEYLLTNTGTTATNQLLRSQEFQTTWGGSNITVTADAAYAPDGTLTADKLAATATASTTGPTQNVTATATSYSYSVYVRQGNAASVRILLRNTTTATDFDQCTFVFATPTVAGGTGWTVEDVGGGWYRLKYTRSTGITIGNTLTVYAGGTGATATAGDFWLAWGAQLEPEAEVTTYIATAGATVTVTRGSDLRLPLTANEGDSIDVGWDNGLYTNRVLRPWAPDLVTNGSFLSAATGWTNISSAGGSIAWNAGMWLDLACATGNAAAVQAVTVEVGKTYAVKVGKLGTNVVVNVGTSSNGSQYVAAGNDNVDIDTTFVATSTTAYIAVNRITPAGTSKVDNVSLRQVPATIAGYAQDLILDHAPADTMTLRLKNKSWRF